MSSLTRMSKNQEQGAFFVIEGTDGSGKGTQFRLLQEKLELKGYEVAVFDFPQYEQPSAYFVSEYLNGRYGTADAVGPYVGSLFYALDRYQASRAIREALEAGKVVLANRFTSSNMAHQGAKIDHEQERKGYYIWLDNLEYEMLKIPRPTKHFVLRVDTEVAQRLVDEKQMRSYTDKKRDIHEVDLEHLRKSAQIYQELCDLFPKDFMQIDCMRNNQLMSIEEVGKILWESVRAHLPSSKNQMKEASVAKGFTKKSSSVKQDNPFIQKTVDGWEYTDEGIDFLKQAISSIDSDVYAFKDTLSATTIAAGMARLSRRGDDMRITILDEFAPTLGKDEKLLQRVISAYGDDSVQQLVGAHIVVENASNLLTKQLEWGRLAAYLEQSTRYIYFDQKDKYGKFKYYTPNNFDAATKKLYESSMDRIFEAYSDLVHKTTEYVRVSSSTPEDERDGAWKAATRAQACDAIRPVLPVATKSTVGIYASGQALEHMIMRLRASESEEAKEAGTNILEQARTVIPTFLERADKPERGGATTAYMANTAAKMKSLTHEHLQETYGIGDQPSATLLSVTPRNEMDVIPYMLYEHSSLPLMDIKQQVDTMPIGEKEKIFTAYMGERLNRRHKPGRALEIPHYTWDIVCDYGIFRDLQRHRIVDNLTWQALTPRYGYDIPKLVEDAGLDEEYEACFDASLDLYGRLQQAGYHYEAQYATLLGHKMRWTITYNARQAFHLHELRTTPHGHPGYRKLINEMHQQLAEVHPLIIDAMKFVNRDEDPELTRLAAERASQYKLQNL